MCRGSPRDSLSAMRLTGGFLIVVLVVLAVVVAVAAVWFLRYVKSRDSAHGPDGGTPGGPPRK